MNRAANNSAISITRPLLICAALITAAVLTACEEEGGTVEFYNDTESTVTILFNGEHTFPGPATIPPGESLEVGTGRSSWPSTITAELPSRRVVFCHEFTWGELKDLDFLVVIDASLAAREQPDATGTCQNEASPQ